LVRDEGRSPTAPSRSPSRHPAARPTCSCSARALRHQEGQMTHEGLREGLRIDESGRLHAPRRPIRARARGATDARARRRRDPHPPARVGSARPTGSRAAARPAGRSRGRRFRTMTAPASSTSSAPELTASASAIASGSRSPAPAGRRAAPPRKYTVVPADRAFPLPAGADFGLGASIGIPAVTAHRALTVAEDGPARLHPGALGDRSVLVAGGAEGSATQRSSWPAGRAQR
jgi:hypothetical protein